MTCKEIFERWKRKDSRIAHWVNDEVDWNDPRMDELIFVKDKDSVCAWCIMGLPKNFDIFKFVKNHSCDEIYAISKCHVDDCPMPWLCREVKTIYFNAAVVNYFRTWNDLGKNKDCWSEEDSVKYDEIDLQIHVLMTNHAAESLFH